MRQSACLVFNIFTGVRFYNDPDLELFILVGWEQSFFVCCLAQGDLTGDSLLLQIFSGVVWFSRDHPVGRQHLVSAEALSLILHGTLCDLFVLP